VGVQVPTGRIVSAGNDGVRFFDPTTGDDAGELSLPTVLSAPVVSPDGASLVTLGDGMTGSVWDLDRGQQQWTFDSTGASTIVAADGADTIAVIGFEGVQVLQSPGTPAGPIVSYPAPGEITAVVVDRSGRRLAVATTVEPSITVADAIGVMSQAAGPGVLDVYDVATGATLATGWSPAPIPHLAFDAEGSRLAVSMVASFGGDAALDLPGAALGDPAVRNEVRVVDATTLAVEEGAAPGSFLAWVDGRIATVADDDTTTVWAADLQRADGVPIAPIAGRPAWAAATAGRLVTSADGGRIAIWDLSRPQGLLGNPLGTIDLHEVSASSDGAYLVAERRLPQPPNQFLADSVSTVVIDADSGAVVAEELGSLGGLSDDDRVLVAGRLRRLPDLAPESEVDTREALDGGVLDPTGTLVVVSRLDGIERRDAVTGDELGPVLPADQLRPASLAFSGDGRRLAISYAGGSPVLVVDVESGEAVGPPLDDPAGVLGVALSPDGRLAALGLANGNVVLRDVESGEQPWLPMQGLVSEAAFVRFGPRVAGEPTLVVAVDATGDVMLFDAGRGAAIGAPLRVAAGIGGAVIARRGGRAELVVAGSSGAMLAPLDPVTWADTACSLAGRDMTEDEWARYFPGRSYQPTCADGP